MAKKKVVKPSKKPVKTAKAPNKIKVAGVVYEKVPEKIRVGGKVLGENKELESKAQALSQSSAWDHSLHNRTKKNKTDGKDSCFFAIGHI